MKSFKIILAVLVIFGAGFFSGHLFSSRAQSRPASTALSEPGETGVRGTNSVPPWERGRRSFIGRLQEDLGLTDEQRDRMDVIFQESRQRTHELWERLREPMAKEVQFVADQVKTVLTPDQQEKYDEMMRSRFRRPWQNNRADADGATNSVSTNVPPQSDSETR